jgi:DNA-binding transcriptional ArsR family regulator
MVVDSQEPDLLFHALSDATRRDIVRRAAVGLHSISDLAGAYPMSFAAVQKHVAVLERAGLVRKRPDGRRRVVTTDMDGLHDARAVLDHYEELWRGRIDRMRDLLDEDDARPTPDPTHQEHRP